MRGIVDNALEVIEFGLEMTEIALNILVEVDLAENCLIQICSELGCRHKTANLSENREVSNRIEQTELINRIRLFLDDHCFLLTCYP